MRLLLRYAGIALVALTVTPLAAPQDDHVLTPPLTPPDVILPNGKSQRDEILKADYQRDLRDAAQLVTLSQALKKELEKSNSHVLSVSSIRKTEEIEKLAKRIRGRMVR